MILVSKINSMSRFMYDDFVFVFGISFYCNHKNCIKYFFFLNNLMSLNTVGLTAIFEALIFIYLYLIVGTIR